MLQVFVGHHLHDRRALGVAHGATIKQNEVLIFVIGWLPIASIIGTSPRDWRGALPLTSLTIAPPPTSF